MTKRTRFRYIVFRISGDGVDKRSVIKWLNGLSRREGLEDNDRLHLVHFGGNQGLVRCTHMSKERVIGLINGVQTIGDRNLEVKSVGTSGTIKAAMSKYVSR